MSRIDKIPTKLLLIVMFVLLTGVVLLVKISKKDITKAQAWWDDSWHYRKAINITNSAGTTLTDFQIEVVVDTATLISTNKMQSDCNDIRFTNINGQLLSYFQNTACDATKTRYWVKVDNLPAPSATIYLYYGNPSAEAKSDRDNTFDISYLGTFSQTFSDSNIASNHGASSDRENNFYISQSGYVNRFNTSWVYQQQFSGLDLYTGLCYDAKEDRFYGIDWSNKQWSTFTTSFTETSPMDQTLGDEPIDCATNSIYVYTNHRNGLICRNKISDNTKECINMDSLSGFDWGGQGLTYAFGYLFAGTTTYGANNNRIYMIDISDWNNPNIVTYWDSSGHTLTEVSGLTWKGKYIYQTSRSQDYANEWQGPVKTAATEPTASVNSEEVGSAPIAYWKFDEGVGSTAHDSMGNRSGTFMSAPIWQSEEYCVSGKCLLFDNVDDGISVVNENFTSLTDYTMCSWINPKGDHKHYTGTIMSSGDWNNVHWAFGVSQTNGAIQTRKADGVNGPTWSYAFPLNQWTHVCITRSGATITAYANGKRVGSPYTGTTGNLVSNATNTAIGRETYAGGYFAFNGLLDEPKIYDYARSTDEIKADYATGSSSKGSSAVFGHKSETAQITPLASKLVTHWSFDEGYETTVNTKVGTNNGTFGTGDSSPTWSNNGKVGKALSFDGTTDKVTIPSLNANLKYTTASNFSISAWVNPAQTTASIYYPILAEQRSTSLYFGLYGNSLRLGLDDGFMTLSGTTIDINQWTHVAVVYDGGTTQATFFVNGKQYNTATNGDIASSTYTTLYIGSELRFGDKFNGLIDEVKAYNQTLTADEILQDYNQGKAAVLGSLSSGTGSTASATSDATKYCLPGDTSACSPPVAEWKFDKVDSTYAFDTSGNSNNGTLGTGNSAPSFQPGKIGNALNFDGNDYISLASTLLSGTTYTVSAWFKATDVSIAQAIFSQRSSTDTDSIMGQLYTTSSKINFITRNDTAGNSALAQSSTTLVNNTWYYVTGVRDGSNVYIYLNGLLDGTDNDAGGTITTDTTDIGRWIYGASYGGYLDGSIDDVKIYNYARTPAQIAWDYNRGQPVGWWKLDDCQGTTAYNSSNNGNNGTINIGASGSQNTAGTCSLGVGQSAAWGNGINGKYNSSLSFDGTDDYVNVTNSSSMNFGTNDFTISFFTYRTANGYQGGSYLRKGNYSAGIDTYDSIFRVNTSTGELARVGLNASLNQWEHHVFVVTQNSTPYINHYINGILNNTGYSGSGNLGSFNSDSYDLRIGHSGAGGANRYFNGSIDDVRIYNYALTGNQIKQIYNNGAVSFN